MISRDLMGMWCVHDKRLMYPDPTSDSEYSPNVFAEPWPCDDEGCSKEKLLEEIAAEEEAYLQEQWNEYNDMVRGGLG